MLIKRDVWQRWSCGVIKRKDGEEEIVLLGGNYVHILAYIGEQV
jgi:hypothetical protein